MTVIHASCIEFSGSGILICGDSGSGKSDLCLRMLDTGANLVADDQTQIENVGGRLTASCPERLRGLLEIRGIGIVTTPTVPEAEIRLKLILQPTEKIARMPALQTESIEGISIPVLRMNPFEASAILKIKTFLSVLNGQRKVIT
ncbi:MAG: HPr kinase/phosphatase C-terminal domain-containing protein [Alphaproteobacteria bacterium]|nr:HPr kinase/phosphatase C-terminal domain-containing protein [Alphaproteobacteria bacterium]